MDETEVGHGSLAFYAQCRSAAAKLGVLMDEVRLRLREKPNKKVPEELGYHVADKVVQKLWAASDFPTSGRPAEEAGAIVTFLDQYDQTRRWLLRIARYGDTELTELEGYALWLRSDAEVWCALRAAGQTKDLGGLPRAARKWVETTEGSIAMPEIPGQG